MPHKLFFLLISIVCPIMEYIIYSEEFGERGGAESRGKYHGKTKLQTECAQVRQVNPLSSSFYFYLELRSPICKFVLFTIPPAIEKFRHGKCVKETFIHQPVNLGRV